MSWVLLLASISRKCPRCTASGPFSEDLRHPSSICTSSGRVVISRSMGAFIVVKAWGVKALVAFHVGDQGSIESAPAGPLMQAPAVGSGLGLPC